MLNNSGSVGVFFYIFAPIILAFMVHLVCFAVIHHQRDRSAPGKEQNKKKASFDDTVDTAAKKQSTIVEREAARKADAKEPFLEFIESNEVPEASTVAEGTATPNVKGRVKPFPKPHSPKVAQKRDEPEPHAMPEIFDVPRDIDLAQFR